MALIHIVTPAERAEQEGYAALVKEWYAVRERTPMAYVHTYGCQQNVADSQRIQGFLVTMGFGFTDAPDKADLILFNTCAVREHAQDRVFGNVGALKAIKARRPQVLIAVCGCMVQQEHAARRLMETFPFVGLAFGTHVLHRFPELMYRALTGKRVLERPVEDGVIAEGLPVYREDKHKAWLSVMYGCNNFCSYCVVPYVRGRERSRRPEDVMAEARELIAQGYTDITLVGQNVNSYGRDAEDGVDFPTLLRRIDALPGDFTLRFMTSHPKDATEALFDAMADCPKVAPHLHLPVQAGSDRVLAAMNRGYTRETYLARVEAIRRRIPHIALTTDIIVGFPGETREEFEQTLSLVREVEYTSLFTFIYSPREGTPAAKLPDPVSHAEKAARLRELTDVQEGIIDRRAQALVGTVHTARVESACDGMLETRLPENIVVRVPGDDQWVGEKIQVRITHAHHWSLTGERVTDGTPSDEKEKSN